LCAGAEGERVFLGRRDAGLVALEVTLLSELKRKEFERGWAFMDAH